MKKFILFTVLGLALITCFFGTVFNISEDTKIIEYYVSISVSYILIFPILLYAISAYKEIIKNKKDREGN